MPVYEFLCEECGYTTEVWATLDELYRGLAPVCERCGSRRLVRKLTAPSLGRGLPTRSSWRGGCGSSGGGGRCCG